MGQVGTGNNNNIIFTESFVKLTGHLNLYLVLDDSMKKIRKENSLVACVVISVKIAYSCNPQI